MYNKTKQKAHSLHTTGKGGFMEMAMFVQGTLVPNFENKEQVE